jgi:hypothetical protein
MARRELRILPYKGDKDYQYYVDGLKVNGKRKRLFFKTEKEVLEELKKRGKQLRKEGEEGQAISADLRILAAKCAERLKPSDAGWDAAVAGCDYVLHVASPLGHDVPRDPNVLIVPARDGALRILGAACRAKVQRPKPHCDRRRLTERHRST